MKILKLSLAAAAVVVSCLAVETRFWQQGDRSDFEKGTLHHLSLRSDGRLFLAPEFREIFDSSTPYLWAIAADSKGNLYTAGGGSGSGSAKLFVIDRAGKSRTFAELEGIEIHSLALDSHDQVYAATDPDGKVYKIGSNGKAEVFYDPHQKYIWAMAFDSKGELYIATGDQGEIHRVGRDGKGSVFFKTEETHARSLAIDAHDNLVVGTEPGGLILRVSPSGQGFVLYQAPKREISAVAIARDDTIYAAGVGNKSLPIPATAPPPQPTPSPIPGSTSGTSQIVVTPVRNTPPPALNLAAPAVAGGSDVYRINPDGSPRKVWSSTQDIAYAIGFDAAEQPLVGTGNKGRIFRLDSDVASTLLLDASPTQVTGFGRGAKGELYAVTGNIGRVYQLGPGFEKSGTFESEVLDAGSFAYWGRISYRGVGNITVSTRSGNLNRPENNWSVWMPLNPDPNAALCDSCGGGRSGSPSARFLQYKIEVKPAPGVPSPEISYVELAYLAKNVAPIVEEIEATPPNYRFPASTLTLTPSNSLTLPPIGQPRRNSSSTLELGSSQTLNYAKGYVGARWLASDENGDALIYRVDIRGVKENEWKLLKDNVKEKYLTWDSTAFPDGEYVIRVTASDAPGNPRNQALEASLISDPFLIDNTPPQILNLAATTSGNRIEIRWKARDGRSDIDKAEYSVNGGEWLLIQPVSKLSDSPEEEYHLVIDRAGPGEQVIAVRVSDEYDNQAVDKVVVR